MISVADRLQLVLPSAKAIGWIVTAGTAMFMAGVGATLRTSDYAELPTEMDSVRVKMIVVSDQVTNNTRALADLERQISNTQDGLDRIRCLARLSATGQVVDPLEIDDVC